LLGPITNGVPHPRLRLEESEMAICLTWRAFTTPLLCMGFSIFFAALGYGAAIFVRGLCLELGFRWAFLGEDGGIAIFFLAFILGGITLGVIVGKKLCCPQRKVSWCGAAAAFLCGGGGGIGVLYVTAVLGVIPADREVLAFLLALVVVPLSSVLGYDVVARTIDELSQM
jgi:hypothetical protein